ncbi:hypothetical protein D3C71_1687480 [compost metagenome]
MARGFVALLAVVAQEDDRDDGQAEARQHPVQRIAFQRRHLQAAIGNEHPGQRIVRLTRTRHVFRDQRVPEEQLQQERHVAHHFDVNRGDLGDEPVLGQTANADQRTEDGGKHDADDGDAQGVEQADQNGPAVVIRGGVVDGRFADRKSGFSAQKPEARGDIAHGQVV